LTYCDQGWEWAPSGQSFDMFEIISWECIPNRIVKVRVMTMVMVMVMVMVHGDGDGAW
jgi:hypothetical protein